MAISFGTPTIYSNTSTFSSGETIDLSSATTDDYRLVFIVGLPNGTNPSVDSFSVDVPSGWTSIVGNNSSATSDQYLRVIYRKFQSGDASTLDITYTGGNLCAVSICTTVSGADGTTFLDVTTPSDIRPNTTAQFQSPSITTSTDGAAVVHCIAGDGSVGAGMTSSDIPSGDTNISVQASSTPSNGWGLGAAWQEVTTAGTVGTVNWGSLTEEFIGASFAIRPGSVAAVPTNTVAPVVSGTETVGSSLSVTNGTWNDNGSTITGYSYQWYSGGSAISGATSSSYTIQTSDINNTIYATVVATNANGDSSPASSNSTGTIPPNAVPSNTVAPALSGTAAVGQTLSVSTGTWTQFPTSYSYQWYSGGSTVGTDQNSYAVQVSDVGNTIYCAVTATNSVGDSTPENSDTSGTVPAVPYKGYNIASNSSTGGSIDIDVPSNVSAGDIIVIFAGNDDNTTTAQFDGSTYFPTGFTFVAEVGDASSDTHTGAFYKVATGSEGGTTVTVPCQDTASYLWATCIVIGNLGSTPYVPDNSTFSSSTSSTSHSVSGPTTSYDNMIVLYGATGDGSDTAPVGISGGTGWTQETYDSTSGQTSGGVSGSWGYKEMSTAGASGSFNIDLTNSDGLTAVFIGIRLTDITYTEIRETFYTNTGSAYSNGTVVYCYTSSGSLDLTGAVGSIVGYDTSTPSAAGAGQAVFTFDPSDTNQRFLVVDPSEDAYGLVTNMITPTGA